MNPESINVDTVECQGCMELVDSKAAYWTVSTESEPFCMESCYERTMESREERLARRT